MPADTTAYCECACDVYACACRPVLTGRMSGHLPLSGQLENKSRGPSLLCLLATDSKTTLDADMPGDGAWMMQRCSHTALSLRTLDAALRAYIHAPPHLSTVSSCCRCSQTGCPGCGCTLKPGQRTSRMQRHAAAVCSRTSVDSSAGSPSSPPSPSPSPPLHTPAIVRRPREQPHTQRWCTTQFSLSSKRVGCGLRSANQLRFMHVLAGQEVKASAGATSNGLSLSP